MVEWRMCFLVLCELAVGGRSCALELMSSTSASCSSSEDSMAVAQEGGAVAR